MIWTDGSMYDGEWQGGIQHGMGRMVFADGTAKEGIFENNIFKQELPKSVPHSQSAVYRKPSLQGESPGAHGLPRANIHSAHSPGQNHMRSTKASSGFQVDPYPYNSNL